MNEQPSARPRPQDLEARRQVPTRTTSEKTVAAGVQQSPQTEQGHPNCVYATNTMGRQTLHEHGLVSALLHHKSPDASKQHLKEEP
eukprot:5109347-Pleurochrysis_carterae.AAC.3